MALLVSVAALAVAQLPTGLNEPIAQVVTPKVATTDEVLTLQSPRDIALNINESSHSVNALISHIASLGEELRDVRSVTVAQSAHIEHLEYNATVLRSRVSVAEETISNTASTLSPLPSTLEAVRSTQRSLIPNISFVQTLSTHVETISNRTTALENKFFEWQPMTHNLVDNSFMANTCNGIPCGFRITTYTRRGNPGSITMQSVHPYTKCFEGPYCNYPNGCPSSRVSTCDDATQGRPFVFSRYNKGPRASRGGLGDGWAGNSNGRILKITGSRTGTDSYNQLRVKFPIENRLLAASIYVRFYLKIIRGQASVQTDVGNRPMWRRNDTLSHPQGWMLVSQVISGSHITNLNSGHVWTFNCYGEGSQNTGPFEMYLALPYMAPVMEKRDFNGYDEASHWQDSVIDNIVNEGLAYWANGRVYPR